MSEAERKDNGPDFSLGVSAAEFPSSGLLRGHVGDEAVLVARSGAEFFAIGATCSHYGASLADGILADDTVRCPWHHACFSVRTGEAIRAPAFEALACWHVEQRGGKVFVTGKKTASPPSASELAVSLSGRPSRIVIVGGGAAGFAAAEMLRRFGYERSLLMLSADTDLPVDRPNLSKDYLAGTAPEEWVPLKPESWYREHGIDLRLNTEVVKLDTGSREIELVSGERVPYGRLLLATGAEPIRLPLPGANQVNVFTLRSLADCRRIIAAAQSSQRVVVTGASFIGLEVAAALRARNLEVHVVAPEKRPLERVFGAELGDFIRRLHEEHGVAFHLENIVASIEGTPVRLKDHSVVHADFVVLGVGVRPRMSLAQEAGLRIDRGVLVSEHLETSAPYLYAAGDVVRWPDRSGKDVRVEHWVVAERLGQTAARNMLGARERYDDVPFFWSQHYDVPINYVGHAESWDELSIDGNITNRDCVVRYWRNGRLLAAASIYRDVQNLEAELSLEAEGKTLKAAFA